MPPGDSRAAALPAPLMLTQARCAADEPSANEAVEGTKVGPANNAQPLAQPVAAGPVKVGTSVPRLDTVTLLVGEPAAVLDVVSSPAGSASEQSNRETLSAILECPKTEARARALMHDVIMNPPA